MTEQTEARASKIGWDPSMWKITHVCGHTTTQGVRGPLRLRESVAMGRAKQPCPDCKDTRDQDVFAGY